MALMRARAGGPFGFSRRGGKGLAARGFWGGADFAMARRFWCTGERLLGPDLAQNLAPGHRERRSPARRSRPLRARPTFPPLETFRRCANLAGLRCSFPEDRSGAVLPSLSATAATDGYRPLRLLRALAHPLAAEDAAASRQERRAARRQDGRGPLPRRGLHRTGRDGKGLQGAPSRARSTSGPEDAQTRPARGPDHRGA